MRVPTSVLISREPGNRPAEPTANQSTQPINQQAQPIQLTDSSIPLFTPVKNQRPFSSGSPGITTWYSSASPLNISSPPSTLTPETGELYVHHNRLDDTYDVWLYGLDRQWKCVTDVEKVYHPVIDDRVLSLRANGTPNWITAASFTTIRGRKVKVLKVVE